MATTFTTLVSFNGTSGTNSCAGLIADTSGNLFGTTMNGGANNQGTVFEITKTANGFASTPATLLSFSGTNGATPSAGLIIDASGNLFSTTMNGGANNQGTAFEIAKGTQGFASAPATLASFNGTNGANLQGGLIADTSGNLFGTTLNSGANNHGTVFEIGKTANGFSSTPTTLLSFNGTNGATPSADLIIDASGNLFGTTSAGGANNQGTVFEIAKTTNGFASTPTTLASFNGTNGANPSAGLVADAAGDLFGTTSGGGANGVGSVFEIAKTTNGFASTPITLASFNGTNGANPSAGLVVDAAGDLFGTTHDGGANNLGTVFEIGKTANGFASTPTTLLSFNGTNGATPSADLIIDASGNLFGTTSGGGANNQGTVFELSGVGSSSPPILNLTGPSKNYAITATAGSSVITVQDKVGTDGTDTLTNTQNIQFTDQTIDSTWFTKTASLSPSQIVGLTELYIASFNRAPDALGLDYWGSQLSNGMSLNNIAASFFVQPEAVAAYPVGQSTPTFVNQVYNNVLGRQADTAGLNYWVGQLQSGSVGKNSFLLAIVNGVIGADVQYLANKEAVGAHFALAQGLSDATWAKTVMSGVNGTAASVTAANTQTDGFAATAATAAGTELVVKILGIIA